MKKVLFVASVAKKHILAFHLPFLKHFKDNGWVTHVAAGNDFDNKMETIPYCDKFIEIPFSRRPISIMNIRALFLLRNLYRLNSYAIVHCHTPIGGVVGRLAYAGFSKGNRPTIIYTAHGFHFFKGSNIFAWVLYYPIEKVLSAVTDIIITINREDYLLAKSKFSRAYNKVYYVPGIGINLDRFNECKVNIFTIRKELSIPIDANVLISVGELNRNKNQSIVIEAISKIASDNIYYIICGTGPMENNLRKMAKTYKIESRIRFLGFREDVAGLLQSSDVFIIPSIREGLSVALMEAMATGIPVIGSDTRGNRDLIDHEKGGFLFKLNEKNALRDAILKALASNRTAIRQHNVNKLDKYRAENVMLKMKEIYRIAESITKH